MLMLTIWPGINTESHGFARSIGFFFRASSRANSPLSTFLSPFCLNRTFNTAIKASAELMNSKWNGARRPQASRRMTGF